MRLQPGLGSQDKFRLHQDASQEQAFTETPTPEPSITPENSAHNLMVTHVGVCVFSSRLTWHLIYWMGRCGSFWIKTIDWPPCFSLTSCSITATLSRGFLRLGKTMIKYSKELWDDNSVDFWNRETCVRLKCVSSVSRSEGGMRRGYMGHLTRIANTVVHNLEKGPVHTQISSLITGVCGH